MKWSMDRFGYLVHHPGYRKAPALTVGRLFAWRLLSLLPWPVRISIPELDLQMYLPSGWRGVAKLVYVFRPHYERELVWACRHLVQGDAFVDVGASIGIYSLAAARRVGAHGRVIAFEPADKTFAVLRRNIAMNGFLNVTLFACALADASGTRWLVHQPDPGRNTLGSEGPGELVLTRTLDEVLDGVNLGHLALVKIDVEGAEELVLRGGARTLRRWQPAVIMEVNPPAASALGLERAGALNFLTNLGYEIYALNEGGSLEPAGSDPWPGNVIAVSRREGGEPSGRGELSRAQGASLRWDRDTGRPLEGRSSTMTAPAEPNAKVRSESGRKGVGSRPSPPLVAASLRKPAQGTAVEIGQGAVRSV